MKQRYILNIPALALLFLLSFPSVFAQTFLNGDFENNTAGTDKINNTNAGYNGYMANSFAFGSYGDMDIITSATYCGLAEHEAWFVAFTGGGTDAISLTTSAPLVQGNSYTISFWDRGCTNWVPMPFQFGLSLNDSTFGTVIYTSPSTPTDGVWTQRTFTFNAPNNGQYITIQTGGALANWTQLDNVQFVVNGPPVVSQFAASDTELCQNGCISFTDKSLNNPTSWSWTFTGAYIDTSTMKNPSSVCYPTTGMFPVTLHASNANGGDTLTVTNYIHVNASPPTPTITQINDTLICSTDPSYTSYQWYANDSLLPGATDTLLIVSANGNYNVEVSNAFGCNIAVGITVVLTGLEATVAVDGMTLYPNPVMDRFTVYGLQVTSMATLYIYNMLGEEASPPAPLQRRGESAVIDVSRLSAGIYFLQIKTEDGVVVRKFVKE